MLEGWFRSSAKKKPARQTSERERRIRQRVVRYFDCTWSSEWREEHCRVSNLSPTGCYIESRFSVPGEGSAIGDLTVTLPGGTLMLQGTVINATPGIGFAVRFGELDAHVVDRLNELVAAESTSN